MRCGLLCEVGQGSLGGLWGVRWRLRNGGPPANGTRRGCHGWRRLVASHRLSLRKHGRRTDAVDRTLSKGPRRVCSCLAVWLPSPCRQRAFGTAQHALWRDNRPPPAHMAITRSVYSHTRHPAASPNPPVPCIARLSPWKDSTSLSRRPSASPCPTRAA